MIKGLLIGRFQPFHKGHAEAVKHCLKHCDKLIIMIGSPKKYGKEYNPFTLKERIKIIQLGILPAQLKKCEITSINDYDDNKKWTRQVEKTKFNIVFTNNPHVKECLKKHEIQEIPIMYNTNATEVRRKMYLNQNWKKCVPKKIAQYLEKIKAPARMKKILE